MVPSARMTMRLSQSWPHWRAKKQCSVPWHLIPLVLNSVVGPNAYDLTLQTQMPVPPGFIASLTCPSTRDLLEVLQSANRPKGSGESIALVSEIKPIDLYCYFSARFGAANGILNTLRSHTSDNLVHWDWTLASEYGWLAFYGENFRTNVHLLGSFPFGPNEKAEIVSQLKADFVNHGAQMSIVRRSLEKWTEFSNPYYRLKRAVDELVKDLKSLDLNPDNDQGQVPHAPIDLARDSEYWTDLSSRYSRGLGLCFGIRSMLPVMAEAFVNLLFFVLMKPEVRRDQRLSDNVQRQPIDIRIKSLNLYCDGFVAPIDFTHEACKHYHTLMNERNNLLHGNVVVEKLRFNEVYFQGRVPIFNEYRSFWQRTIGLDAQAVGLGKVLRELEVVDDFIAYLLSTLTPAKRRSIELIAMKRDLGQNEEDGRLGILFPDHLVDARMGESVTNSEAHPETSD